jgi:hypothetical protein
VKEGENSMRCTVRTRELDTEDNKGCERNDTTIKTIRKKEDDAPSSLKPTPSRRSGAALPTVLLPPVDIEGPAVRAAERLDRT